MQRLLGSRGVLVAVGGVAVILVAAYFLVWHRSDHPSAYSKERTSFGRVGTQFEARLQQLRQRDESLSKRHVVEFAASHDVHWGIVQADSGNERDGNLNDWSPVAVERATSTETSTQGFAYIKTGPDEDRYVATYAHPVEIFGQGNAAIVLVKVYD